MSVPDYCAPIVAYRVWGVDRKTTRLRARFRTEDVWEPKRPKRATCRYMDIGIVDDGVPPHRTTADCVVAMQKYYGQGKSENGWVASCGLYGYKTPLMAWRALGTSDDWDESRIVFGEVKLWGRVLEHERGFRAEYAYPGALAALSPVAEELADVYGVPVTALQGWTHDSTALTVSRALGSYILPHADMSERRDPTAQTMRQMSTLMAQMAVAPLHIQRPYPSIRPFIHYKLPMATFSSAHWLGVDPATMDKKG